MSDRLLPQDERTRSDSMNVAKIFFARSLERQETLNARGLSFAHYTSAEAAISILLSNEVWLRNAAVMNDFSEVTHGHNCLDRALRSQAGDKLKQFLCSLGEIYASSLEADFKQWESERIYNTYIVSFAEHGIDQNEIEHGRLSMWRAYGGETNVALIVDKKPFQSETNALNAYTLPVCYCDVEQYEKEIFPKWIDQIFDSQKELKSIDPMIVYINILTFLHLEALCLKHPGFAEEREWRVFSSPSLFPSNHLREKIVNISGVPQKIQTIPLKDYSSEGLEGLEIKDLLKEVIIGPMDNSVIVGGAIAAELQNHGLTIEEAYAKLRVSGIPLRR